MKLIFTSATVFDETLKTFLDEEFQKLSEPLEITINANIDLLSSLTPYLNNPKIPRTYLIKLENISQILAWASEVAHPGKFEPYIKNITECAISEIHYVYKHFSLEETAKRLNIKKEFVDTFADSIIPPANYNSFGSLSAPDLQHMLGNDYNKSYAHLANSRDFLLPPDVFNATDLTSNKQLKRGEVDHTVEEIHVKLMAEGKRALNKFGCASDTFPRVLGRSKFNLNPEKLMSMSKQAAQKLWGCEYYQKISNNGIDLNHFTTGLIYAVAQLSSSQFEAAGRLGTCKANLGKLLRDYRISFQGLRYLPPDEASKTLPGYQMVAITDNDYLVPLNGIKSEYHKLYHDPEHPHPMVFQPPSETTVLTPERLQLSANPLSSSFAERTSTSSSTAHTTTKITALTKLNCLSESLEKAIDFTQIPYEMDATFKLHFAPETGALVITPTDISQLGMLQQKLEEHGIETCVFTHYLYIDDTKNIKAFFSTYFATKQNEINQELKDRQEFGSATLTVLQKLVLIAIGLCIYERNKKELNFNFTEENIRCPWIDPDNNLCIEIIINSNGKKEKLILPGIELQNLNLNIAPLFLELLPMIQFGNKYDVVERADHLNNTNSRQLRVGAPETPVNALHSNHSFFIPQSGEPAAKRRCTSQLPPIGNLVNYYEQQKALQESALIPSSRI